MTGYLFWKVTILCGLYRGVPLYNAIAQLIGACWDELDFTHGQNIGSSVELSWHLCATSSELVANDA